MTGYQLEWILQQFIEEFGPGIVLQHGSHVATYEEVGLMSAHPGLCFQLPEGQNVRLTIHIEEDE